MKKKDNQYNGKGALTCQPIEWEKYRIQLDESVLKNDKDGKDKYEWDRPVVNEHWTVDFEEKETAEIKKAKNDKIVKEVANSAFDDLHIPTLSEIEKAKNEALEKSIINATLMQDDELMIKVSEKEGRDKESLIKDEDVHEISSRNDLALRRLESLNSEPVKPSGEEVRLKQKALDDLAPAKEALQKASLTAEQSDAKKVSDRLSSMGAKSLTKEEEAQIKKSTNEKIIIKSSEVDKKKKKSDAKKSGKIKPAAKKKGDFDKKASKKNSAAMAADNNFDTVSDNNTGIGDKKTAESKASRFRKEAINWKDEKFMKEPEEEIGTRQAVVRLFERVRHFSALSWAVTAMAVVIFITGVMTTVVYANYQCEQNKAMAIASLSEYIDIKEDEVLEEVEETDLQPAAAEPEEEKVTVLSLVLSSVDKDLKIKLVDDEDLLVKNVPWSVTLSDKNEEETIAEDDDEDGIIHLEGMSAGDYSVTLNPSDSLMGYILPSAAQVCSVKATIEYKVIANIKEEIKSEKEVNAAAEDANGNQAIDVETGTIPTDTVEWCESTKTATGDDSYVEATVDITKTAKETRESNFVLAVNRLAAVASGNYHSSALGLAGLLVADTESEISLSTDVKTTQQEVGAGQTSEPTGTPTEEPTPTTDPAQEPTPTPTEPPMETPTEIPTETPTATPTPTVVPTPSATPTPTPTPTAVPTTSVILVTGIQLSGGTSVDTGKTITISASVTPSNASNKAIQWSSSDTSIAAVDNNGIVTGVKAGSAVITAAAADKSGIKSTVTINVVATGEYPATAQLYDANKNALYVNDNGSYRLAKYSDYLSKAFSKYYRKLEGFLYTGWQTIDGNTYYYTSDNKYVTGTQVIQGVTYTFSDTGQLAQGSGTLGIDVSKYQPSINWSSVKASGISFAIVRCGYRGASTGVLIQDPYYTSHVKGAKAAGLKVGIYFFSTALTEMEAVEEASMCAALASGYGINYPVFLDVEPSSRAGYNSLPKQQRTANIKAFINTVKSAGYTPGVYANKEWFTNYINTSEISGAKIWLAQYNAAGPTYKGRYDLWQYTSKGHIDGISGNVDMNHSYLGY